jgi:hypothetical protein
MSKSIPEAIADMKATKVETRRKPSFLEPHFQLIAASSKEGLTFKQIAQYLSEEEGVIGPRGKPLSPFVVRNYYRYHQKKKQAPVKTKRADIAPIQEISVLPKYNKVKKTLISGTPYKPFQQPHGPDLEESEEDILRKAMQSNKLKY